MSQDFKSVWEYNADIDNIKERQKTDYAGKNIIGKFLHLFLKKQIYCYADFDKPKIEWLKKAISGTGTTLLDVGVRDGNLAGWFKAHGKQVYGIDIAQEYVLRCKEKGLINDGCVCNVETDSLPEGLFDVVFLGEILEHLLDGGAVLNKIAQVCKPGGCIIITTPNLAFIENRIKLMFGLNLNRLTIDQGELGNQHIRVFTIRLLKKLLENAGFEVVDSASDGLPISLSRFISTGNTSSTLISVPLKATLGRTIYIKAILR